MRRTRHSFLSGTTLASPQTSFGVRLSRIHEGVTNEPQRTSAGRLERHKTLVKRFVGETTAHRIITFLLSSLSAAKMIENISQAMLTPYRTAFPVDIKSYLGTHSMNTMYPVSRRYVILHFRDAQLLEACLALTSV